MSKKALVVIDVQNDFVPGGALAVPDGHKVIETINTMMDSFDSVILTQDWHTQDDPSFESSGGPWPPHCVEGTLGAELHPELAKEKAHHVVKGRVNDKTSGTDLVEYLRSNQIEEVTMTGLALDYCVRETALALADAGFRVKVHLPGTRAVSEETARSALRDFEEAGIEAAGALEEAVAG
jgi:nicotinamidase/pyrazinamidase